MSTLIERRDFLGLALVAAVGDRLGLQSPMPATAATVGPAFPQQDPALVQEMVGVAHRDLARVKALLDAHPELAKATMDWGFGDWEDALGAASHTGRAEIAELLLAHGARPTIFSAAMLGQLDTVKAFITASPGCQRILGPHGLTLLSHAKAGGERAKATRAYLEELGDADITPASVPLDPAARATYAGNYAFGARDDERLIVAAEGATGLTIMRPRLPFARGLRHRGNHEFFPVGANSVRIRFTVTGERATALAVLDPDVVVSASRAT